MSDCPCLVGKLEVIDALASRAIEATLQFNGQMLNMIFQVYS